MNKKDTPSKCTYLLSQWKKNLNITNYEKTKFANILEQLNTQIKKLESRLKSLKIKRCIIKVN